MASKTPANTPYHKISAEFEEKLDFDLQNFTGKWMILEEMDEKAVENAERICSTTKTDFPEASLDSMTLDFEDEDGRETVFSLTSAPFASIVAPSDHHQSHQSKNLYNESVLNYFALNSSSSMNSEKIMEDYLHRIADSFKQEGPVFATQITPQSLPISQATPASGQPLSSYLSQLKVRVDSSTRTGAPNQIGHMSSSLPFFHRPLAKLITTLNQNNVKVETASTFTGLEKETIAMLHSDFYACPPDFYETYRFAPDSSLGVACSGGTVANITAMWTARNKSLPPRNSFLGVAKEGLAAGLHEYGYSKACIVGSRLLHYSFKKAADLLGFGEDGLVLVDTDSNYRLKLDALKSTIDKCIAEGKLVVCVVGICGTTETGSIDPLDGISKICSLYNIHFHVDAAWGGPLHYSPEHSHKLRGIQAADSITIDGHKQLYTPLGLGILLFRNPTSAKSIQKSAQYVIRHDSPDLGKFTLEGSRPAHIIYLHASLTLLGRQGLGLLITRSCALVRQMAVRLSTHPSKSFQVLHDPQSNILLYRYIPAHLREVVAEREFTRDESRGLDMLVERMQKYISAITDSRPHTFTSRTTVLYNDMPTAAFRVVISNPNTTWRHIEEGIAEQVRVGSKMERKVQVEEIMQRLADGYEYDAAKGWIGWPYEL